MEDNSTPSKAIETHPKWEVNGWIWGTFHLPVTYRSGDRFRARVGFLKGASAGNVTFIVFAGVPGAGMECGRKSKAYTGTLEYFECTLPTDGSDVTLVVLANGPSNQDWAVWIDPQLIIIR